MGISNDELQKIADARQEDFNYNWWLRDMLNEVHNYNYYGFSPYHPPGNVFYDPFQRWAPDPFSTMPSYPVEYPDRTFIWDIEDLKEGV